MTQNTRNYSLSLNPSFVRLIEFMTDQNAFPTRSECIRVVLERFMTKNKPFFYLMKLLGQTGEIVHVPSR